MKYCSMFVSIFIISFFFIGSSAHAAPAPCHQYVAGLPAQAGFGAAYDPFSSTNQLLLTATCDTSNLQTEFTIGYGHPDQYVYELGYRYRNGAWEPLPLQGSNKSGQWYPGSGSHTVTLTQAELGIPQYFVGYTCHWDGFNWKCGCRDRACNASFWQLQAFNFPAGVPGGGGNSSGSGSTGGGTAPLPGLPDYFGLGAKGNESFAFNWMKEIGNILDYRYAYLAGGSRRGSSWINWNSPSGQYALNFMNTSRQEGYIPVLTLYQIVQSEPNSGQEPPTGNYQNNTTMNAYYDEWELLMRKAGEFGDLVIIHVEPDLWGFFNKINDNPNNVRVSVRSSGHSDAQFADTAAGFAQALVSMRDKYAPNALLGFHATTWVTHSLYRQNTSATEAADEVANFYDGLNVDFDLIFYEYSDRDAGYYDRVRNQPDRKWEPSDYERMYTFMENVHRRTGKPGMIWQIPLGNYYYLAMNNTRGHYQDEKVEYLLEPANRDHLERYIQVGTIAALFGDGQGEQTHFADRENDGVNNPGPITGITGIRTSRRATHTDDDGGYFRSLVQQYYQQGPVPLQ